MSRFHIALLSAIKQTHCTLVVACDSVTDCSLVEPF